MPRVTNFVLLLVQDRSAKAESVECAQNDRRITIFAGAAKAYESYGTEVIISRLKASGSSKTPF